MKRLTMIATIALAMGGVVACGGKTETANTAVETEKIEKVEVLTLAKEKVARA